MRAPNYLLGVSGKRRYVVRDTFTRADSAVTLGNAETGQAWTALSGTWGVTSGRAKAQGSAAQWVAVVNAGVSDGTLSFVLGAVGTDGGVVLRATDDANYLLLAITSNALNLYRKQANTYNSIGAFNQVGGVVAGNLIRIDVKGSSIKVYQNGVLRISATEAFQQTATRWGLRDNGAAGTKQEVDNFTIWW